MNSGWISVEERLPEAEGHYLVHGGSPYKLTSSMRWLTTSAEWWHGEWWCDCVDGYEWEWSIHYEAITHWQPLPEPPEGRDGTHVHMSEMA